jgi:hypothetical protein
LRTNAHDFDLPAISGTTNDKKLIDKVPAKNVRFVAGESLIFKQS